MSHAHQRDFSHLANRQFDLLVIGGGIYGAWTAYDAALRGLTVALVDQGDWAGATSSASSKLIHGGLRYLETYDFKLVKKALKERQMLLATAPHRIWPLRFGVPVFSDSRIGALQLKAGLSLYDFLAGWPDETLAHQYLGHQAFTAHFPLLKNIDLLSGYSYGDAQTDDARLVLELITGAMAAGAICVNYCKQTDLIESNGLALAAVVQDQLSEDHTTIHARQIVNTTGRWVSSADLQGATCRLTKGIHLVMPPVLAEEALLLTAKQDGRVFFMIPWYGMTLLGTTDTDYHGPLVQLSVTPDEVDYLLNAVNHYLNTPWTTQDVIGRYAGLRAMQYQRDDTPSALSRDWALHTAANGVHYAIGGKLTSSRSDAARIVDTVCAHLAIKTPCATLNRLFPWAPEAHYASWQQATAAHAIKLAIDSESAKWLIRRHGKRVNEVLLSVEKDPALAARIIPNLPFIYADLLFCARTEMVVHLDDLLRRRMPLLILARLTHSQLQHITLFLAEIMGWDEADRAREIEYCRPP